MVYSSESVLAVLEVNVLEGLGLEVFEFFVDFVDAVDVDFAVARGGFEAAVSHGFSLFNKQLFK